MYILNMGQARKYRNQSGEGGDSGNGGAPAIDLNNPELQKIIQAQIEKEVSGLKSKNSELLGKLKETQQKFTQYEGIDVDKARALMQRMEQDEELKLLAEGKVDEVVNRRIELRERDWKNQYSSLEGKVQEYEQMLSQKEERLRQLTIDGQVTQAFQMLGYEPTAMEEMIYKARQVFIMDENGSVVPRDAHGNIIYGKDAKTPISVTAWLESLAESKPWLRGVNKGSGAQPNRGSGAKVDTSKMTSAQRIAEGLKQRGIV